MQRGTVVCVERSSSVPETLHDGGSFPSRTSPKLSAPNQYAICVGAILTQLVPFLLQDVLANENALYEHPFKHSTRTWHLATFELKLEKIYMVHSSCD